MGQSASQPASAVVAPPPSHPTSGTPPPGCPMHASTPPPPAPAQDASAPAKCPIDHSATKLDPRNQMPHLPQTPTSPNQTVALPTERTSSSIPRDTNGTWDYPSPQQFYNALVRKGWETPEEHVETMVEIHNWLNEKAWDEVLKWERRQDSNAKLELSRFQGRPGELSPKARLYMLAGWFFPSHFNTEPPFDRHDWIVRRPQTGEEVRYVIDYYSLPPEPDGSPAFSLDVRPALDSFSSVRERIAVATEEAWASFRESQPPKTA